MQSLAHSAVVIVTIVTFVTIPRWLSRRSKPAEQGDGRGRITPGKASAAVVTASGVLFSAAGCTGIWFGDVAIGSLLFAVGGALALFMAPSLTHWHDVVWTEATIEGPSRMFGLTLGRARTRLRWGEIARTGTTLTGYSFVETADRRRVYWSYLYRGFAVFEGQLELHRPDLFGDEAIERNAGTTTLGEVGPRNDRPARPSIDSDAGPAGTLYTRSNPGDLDS
ncbi:hypothetical protein GCM10009087_01360 [Sphingomonas oligophenolica]|uniref:PH domain-containing protein n=1 Tax=Sphingomonas oligophenolica TaxID=301154 RepID=A0ABU9Y129_9SPHN